jgi:roadblock/LC7 domain-containing protein
MPQPIALTALLETEGVLGAVRWRQSILSSAPTPPHLVEYVGEISEDRAQRLIAHSEAAGMAVFGISQLSYQRARNDKTVVYPVDSYYVHGQYTSVIATINAVAALLDNKATIDIQGLISQMILVDNT